MNVQRQKATDEEVAAALYDLDGAPKKVRAADWPSDLVNLSEPGLYSWWVDEPGAKDLTDRLRHAIQAGRIYVGQTAGLLAFRQNSLGDATEPDQSKPPQRAHLQLDFPTDACCRSC